MNSIENPSPDPDVLRLPDQLKGELRPKKPRTPRHRRGELFVKGPIPWNWIRRAMLLGGRAPAASMLIWRERWIQDRHPLKLCTGWIEDLGIDYQAARRAIRALKAANLIHVSQLNGRCFEVTILPVDEP